MMCRINIEILEVIGGLDNEKGVLISLAHCNLFILELAIFSMAI